jgi:enoyl-CoA hydratase/carnithine racemase
MPFAVAARDGVLTLTLDTPGSPVNIFNHATARQLSAILAGVRPSDTRAIVVQSAKPGSFLNGVGLLLAHASQTYATLVDASTPPWQAYRALREAPVPTVAVVDGTCFGCGVELSLCCDFRVATDNAQTCFYMTELNDYLFVPLFGSTWTLPETVGLDDAIELLLWGARWDGATAFEHGLADALVASTPAARDAAVDALLARRQPSRRRGPVAWGDGEERALARARARIAALPPSHQPVYRDALALLAQGARQTDSLIAHQRRELDRSAASALATVGKSAYAFFYLRQMASERAVGRAGAAAERDLALAVAVEGDHGVGAFVERLRQRPLAGVQFVAPEAADLGLVAGTSSTPHDGAAYATVQLAPTPGPRAPLALCLPATMTGGRLVELAVAPDADQALAARLARAVQRWGFEVARSAPGTDFVCHQLLLAFLEPLLRHLRRHGDVRRLNTTLRHAGFRRRPHALLAAFDGRALAAPLARRLGVDAAAAERLLADLHGEAFDDGAGDPLLVDALAVSLLHTVLAVRAAGQLRDPSVVDLIARELLDFPLTLRSLCSWLQRNRVASALEREPALVELAPHAALETARLFVAEGREFYRGAGRAAA